MLYRKEENDTFFIEYENTAPSRKLSTFQTVVTSPERIVKQFKF